MKTIKNLCLIGSVFWLSSYANLTYGSMSKLVTSKEKIAQWIELKKVTAEEKLAWQQQQRIIEDRLNILNIEEQTLAQQLQRLNEKQSLSESRRKELLEQKKALAEQSVSLRNNLDAAIYQIKQLYPRLPHTLQKQITTIFDSSLAKLSDIQATEMTVEALNAIEIFANRTTVAQEVRTISITEAGVKHQKDVLVNVLFLGLGVGYYLSEDGQYAGIGLPTKDKWLWQPQPSIKDNLKKAFEIANGKVAPALVEIPVRIGVEQ